MKKRVKYVNRAEANKQIQVAHEFRRVIPAFREALKSFEGLKTIEEIDAFLNDKTGFVNVELSATAMGLEAEYGLMKQYLGKINLKNYDANGLVTQKYKDKCFLDYTQYYSDEDVELFEAVEKALEKLNALELPVGCLTSDHKGQVTFNEQRFDVSRQLTRGSRYAKQEDAKEKLFKD